jgi:hypothetical protein
LFKAMDCRVKPGNDSSRRDVHPGTVTAEINREPHLTPALLGAIPKPEKVLRTVL